MFELLKYAVISILEGLLVFELLKQTVISIFRGGFGICRFSVFMGGCGMHPLRIPGDDCSIFDVFIYLPKKFNADMI